MKKNRFLSMLLFIAFIPAIFAQEPRADWVDRSGDLPGMVSDGEMIGLLVGLGVVVTGLVVVLVVKKKQDSKIETTSLGNSSYPNLGLTTSGTPGTFYNQLNKAAENSPLQIFADFDQLPNQSPGSNLSMSLGVRLKF